MSFFALFESSIFASTEVRAPTRTSTSEHARTRGRVHKWSLCIASHLLFVYSSANDFRMVIMNFSSTIYTLSFHIGHR